MKLDVLIEGRKHTVEITGPAPVSSAVDGRPLDAVQVAPGVYSVLANGQSIEVRVEERGTRLRIYAAGRELSAEVIDPRRWRGRRAGGLEAEGRQQILAPMPGKVVRLLVQSGDQVEAGQGIMVVEAMKMQNEIRSPKSGKIERLLVTESQAVNAGEVLAVIA
jgi:biotin carboxyl carrier protein